MIGVGDKVVIIAEKVGFPKGTICRVTNLMDDSAGGMCHVNANGKSYWVREDDVEQLCEPGVNDLIHDEQVAREAQKELLDALADIYASRVNLTELFDGDECKTLGDVVKFRSAETILQKRKECKLEVGDEVYNINMKPCVVTGIHGRSVSYFSSRGESGEGYVGELKRTGTRYPQIQEVLDKLVDKERSEE